MRPIILVLALLLNGCVTNDFAVVDALRVGMSDGEAQATIQSYGFQREQSVERPALGWPEPVPKAEYLAASAGVVEARLGQLVQRAEYYPVHHGLLGFGQLYLFYGEGNRLLHFYRHQIN